MSLCVGDIDLPGPTTKLLVYHESVFKVKYKLSDSSLQGRQSEPSYRVQKDIKRITRAVLECALNSEPLVPLRTDYMVVYPGLLTWSTVVSNKFIFFHNQRHLRAHPEVVHMLVHVFSHPPQDTLLHEHVIRSIAEEPACRMCLGKRSPADHPDNVVLPAFTGLPSNDLMIRKKLKYETEPLQTASTATMNKMESTSQLPRPSSEEIARVAREIKTRLEELSQPTRPPNAISMELVLAKPSVFGDIFRSVKRWFGFS